MDATANPTVKAAQGVSGYPTLKFYRDGVVSLYSGPRTSDALVAFAERMTGNIHTQMRPIGGLPTLTVCLPVGTGPAVRLLGTLGAVREFGAKNQVSFIFAKVGLALHQMRRRRGKHCVVVTPHHPPCSCLCLVHYSRKKH